MAAWTLVDCLVSLRSEFNTLSPGRDKSSDGSIGDQAHAGNSSDHNPDETGNAPTEDADSKNEVHAIDVDADLRKPGWTMHRAVDIIVGRHRTGLDDRLQNVIYDRRIASRSWGWTWRPYTGANAHTEHAHFSARYTSAQEADTSPWGLIEEDDTMTKSEFIALLTNPEVRAAMCRAVWNTDDVVRAPGSPAAGTGPDGKPVNTHWAASSYLQNIYAAAVSARTYSAAAAKDDADEAAIIAGVLAGLDPAAIAAAIPPELARLVADELAARLAA